MNNQEESDNSRQEEEYNYKKELERIIHKRGKPIRPKNKKWFDKYGIVDPSMASKKLNAWFEEKNNEILISKKDSYPDLLEVDDEKEVKMLIGSTRYPTFGNRINSVNTEQYAQPFLYKTKYGKLTLVHNGNITNIPVLSEKKYESDTSFIVEFLGETLNEKEGNLEQAIQVFMEKIDGSYSIVGIYKDYVLDQTDGLKFVWEDKWIQFRVSNTEPVVRIIAEGKSKIQVEELLTPMLTIYTLTRYT